MKLITLIGFVVLAATASGQRQASYYDYDYQDGAPARHQNFPPRSYARAAAPAQISRHAVQAQPRPTPVPILKQINRHNDDGSYTYGYEGADGSFKIETKLPTGEVMGKYGYVDDTGKLRVIDYGANRYGFQPAGEGITVAPPTLVDETTAKDGKKTFADYDDEPAYVVQPKPPRQQKRPEVFIARQPQSAPRSYNGFEQELRPAPTPVYQEVPPEFAAAQTPVSTPVRFASAPRRPSPTRFVPPVQAAPVEYSRAPVPQRVSIPNAVPVGPVFTPAANPPPPRPAPVRESHSGTSSGSLLDQLVKQYALPSGVGQPLHDITFGSYSSQTSF